VALQIEIDARRRRISFIVSISMLRYPATRSHSFLEGRLPRSIGATRLRDAPAEWSRQYAMLGLSL
jgi:hypothetical protein